MPKLQDAYRHWLERMDLCKTINDLQQLNDNLEDVVEEFEDEIGCAKQELREVEEKLLKLEAQAATCRSVKLVIEKMAYHRFVREDEGWEIGGNWREWYA